MTLLDKSIDDVVTKAKNAMVHATKQATHETVSAYTTELYDKNQSYIANMDTVFSENMGLMQELHSDFDPQPTITKATNTAISDVKHETTTLTKSAIVDIKRESDTIIQELTSKLDLDLTKNHWRLKDTPLSSLRPSPN